ncbi:MAG: hypothetical protein M5R41_00330 [Bacteroidia bacterium]|nr:hypothetical protein [Bacteroidia bacterium]
MDTTYCYSPENVLRQIEGREAVLGVFELRFYSSGGRPAKEMTECVETFYYYPSGGTIRDASLNILLYEPRLDIYHTGKRG